MENHPTVVMKGDSWFGWPSLHKIVDTILAREASDKDSEKAVSQVFFGGQVVRSFKVEAVIIQGDLMFKDLRGQVGGLAHMSGDARLRRSMVQFPSFVEVEFTLDRDFGFGRNYFM